eukprot:jgi/Psemu1/42670/gm1.42670_g
MEARDDSKDQTATCTRTLDCSEAKKAKEMQETLGLPTSEELIRMIDNNLIKDFPSTHRDIKIMTVLLVKTTD